jgi:hypothetical protein
MNVKQGAPFGGGLVEGKKGKGESDVGGEYNQSTLYERVKTA